MLIMAFVDLRTEYSQRGLSETDLDPNPIRQFGRWFEEAAAAGVDDPHAMTLATATPDGQPSARIVLLKTFDEAGFVFYTNYQGRKGRELLRNPHAALLFFWPELGRQVRIEGTVTQVSVGESEAYFRSRPRESCLAAWASPQSEVVPSRAALEERVAELARQFADADVPCPPHWGGFRVRPTSLEFWQGRTGRLHDRLRYRQVEPAGWRIERLAP
jgi:pyridoxamine 5'-phosphate oxidase